MLEEYGVNVDSIKVGDNVDLLSPFSDLAEHQVQYSSFRLMCQNMTEHKKDGINPPIH